MNRQSQNAELSDLNAWFGTKQALKEINISIIKANAVTAIIGPSGCGKSTFIRSLNRMHELVPERKNDRTSASWTEKTSTTKMSTLCKSAEE